jgi:hypothetical protein
MPSMPGLRRALTLTTASMTLLTGCALPFKSGGTPAPQTLASPTPAPTAPATRSLTVCLGAEPDTLYRSPPNAAARSVGGDQRQPDRHASYDYQPVISRLPRSRMAMSSRAG